MKKTVNLILLALCFVMLLGCFNVIFQTKSETTAASKHQSTLEILTITKTAQKFTSEPISEDHLKQILAAGLNAPSAINSQPWHFSVVRNQKILNQINEAMAGAMPKGGPGGPGAPSVPARKLGLADATVAFFIYAANKLPSDSFDCGLATEAMSIAALSLGYGTKIVSSPSIVLNGERKADFDKLLQIPEGYSNVAVLLIGHTDQSIDATTSASTRSTMEQKVRFIK